MALIGLDELRIGEGGVIRNIDESKFSKKKTFAKGEIEGRLLEMGFIEGAMLKVLHFGMFGRNPIAVRINNSSSIIALRKEEASTILVERC